MYTALKFGWRVPHNTQSLAVREVCQAIIEEYLDEAMTCPTTPEGWYEISDQFMEKWNFQHTCGSLDSNHVACKAPQKSGSVYYNNKEFYSIVLMAMVDADYKFLWADVVSPGASSDAQIYNESELKQMAEDGTIGFPTPDPLPNAYKDVPYFFVGEDAFGLRKQTIKTYTLCCLQLQTVPSQEGC
ncbi:uncharacterized protein LOC125376877 [Haliotis rufescens]|uniref:uncharacterized protein LOC125376877 n=1 Tax=Haliotis rufescens TaxID=6454 RepID=UPI00201EC83F|nr:uncharacterized protein LOC125376877 [Haliotis rufescens]